MLPVRVRSDRLAPWRDPFWGMDSGFSDMVRRFFGDGGPTPVLPGSYDVDIWEDGDHLYVEAELPGLTSADVDVTLENGVLTIHGRKDERKREGTQHLSELRYGEFTRSFTLPTGVDEDKVNAQLKDGVLRITLDKKEEAKPRRIKVQG